MGKKTLVLGASLNEARYSNIVIHKLLESKHPVKAIGFKEGVISSVIVSTEKKIFKSIDTVTLYLNPKRQEIYYKYIISLKPRRVIFNPGTENLQFIELLQENKIESEIACTLVLLSTKQY